MCCSSVVGFSLVMHNRGSTRWQPHWRANQFITYVKEEWMKRDESEVIENECVASGAYAQGATACRGARACFVLFVCVWLQGKVGEGQRSIPFSKCSDKNPSYKIEPSPNKTERFEFFFKKNRTVSFIWKNTPTQNQVNTRFLYLYCACQSRLSVVEIRYASWWR